MALGGGYFKPTYESDLALVDTRLRRTALALMILALLLLPRLVSPFVLDLVAQTALAAVGALSLNLLTGLAGQVSLGHAGFIAAGAFTTAMLVENRLPSPLLATAGGRSEEHTSELQSQSNLVCRLLLEKKKKREYNITTSS